MGRTGPVDRLRGARRPARQLGRLALLALAGGALLAPACESDGHFTILGYTTAPNYDTRIRTVRVPIFKSATFFSVQPAPGLEFPSAQDVINRVLTTARTMDLASAAVAIELFLGTSGNASPACVFRGVLRVSPNPTTLAVAEWTPHPLCWTIERFVLGRLLSDRDQAGELLRSFRFEVLGEKLEDGRPYYLVYGKALAAQSDALSVIGWVDYDRGLVTDDAAVRQP